ncbi:hypothetical protein TTRE_0000148901 [Trichuris trichiura]|uniref:Uncharacterized protein n=1 Tax=Trichuris trichiura TaxID=36087 RepID=A0A077Z3D4_TRITR|nr:hypothetical protein TTRE_0000148901 [Trichuris trichiura]
MLWELSKGTQWTFGSAAAWEPCPSLGPQRRRDDCRPRIGANLSKGHFWLAERDR